MLNFSRRVQSAIQQQVSSTTKAHIESSIIPASFMLGGLTINIVRDDSMVSTRGLIGEARYTSQQICLDASVAPLQSLEQSYLHELTHWIFYLMNEDELRNNERLVDLFAHFLYQAMVTAKFEPPASIEASPSV